MSYFSAIYIDNLPHRAKTVYMYLRDRANEKRSCWPGINRIATDLNMSRSTVKRALELNTKRVYREGAALPRQRQLQLQLVYNSEMRGS